jgi:hypothetical protein
MSAEACTACEGKGYWIDWFQGQTKHRCGVCRGTGLKRTRSCEFCGQPSEEFTHCDACVSWCYREHGSTHPDTRKVLT